MLATADRLADLLVEAPVIDCLGLTVESERVRRTAAESLASYLVERLRGLEVEERQLPLPL